MHFSLLDQSSSISFYCINRMSKYPSLCFFFFNDTATTEIYTLSLHDALPISKHPRRGYARPRALSLGDPVRARLLDPRDRKSTRLNSSHGYISYAVFCLKKKKTVQ